MQDEIETEEIIKDIFQQGKTCFIPRYQFQSNHMDMVKLASPEEISSLPKTSWNIHQPSEVEVREEALSTGSLLSSTTSEPVEMRVCQWDLPFYFSTLTTIFLVILGPCKVDLKISQRHKIKLCSREENQPLFLRGSQLDGSRNMMGWSMGSTVLRAGDKQCQAACRILVP
ncbi:5-formyltetrahydrofolate cyclo-ligase isoform X7 [Eubalaena glacialis]|nr:5-formyltetrahydrofolate cyclo-ligase isoform X7 [Eubalaena glacialis]